MKTLFALFSCSILLIRGCNPPDNYSDPDAFVQLSTTDTLRITCERDTFVRGSEGTMLYIPAHAFVLGDSQQVTGEVQILLDEYYQLDELMVQKLATCSQGEALKSDGIINLSAQQDGEQLQLAEGKEVVVHFPKIRAVDEYMKLYTGCRTADGNMNWVLDSSSLQRPKAFLYEYGMRWEELGSQGLSPFYLSGDQDTDLYTYFLSEFDQSTLLSYEALVGSHIRADFDLDENGEIQDLRVYTAQWHTEEVDSLTEREADLPMIEDFIRGFSSISAATNAKGIPVEAEASLYFAIDWAQPAFLNDEAYLLAFQQKFGEDGADMSAQERKQEYYMLSSGQLGWISCNSNWEVPLNQQTNISVATNRNPYGSVYLIFPDLNCIIPGEQRGGNVYFNKVPLGKKGQLVALGSDGETPLAGFEEIWIEQDGYYELEIKPTPFQAIRKQLKALNRKPSNPSTIPTAS